MGLIWHSLIFLAAGAICTLAMIWISDRLQHREPRVSSIRTQDILQYQLDTLTAPHNLPIAKQMLGQDPLEEFRPEKMSGSQPEPIAESHKAGVL
jgi:hypothetical protein